MASSLSGDNKKQGTAARQPALAKAEVLDRAKARLNQAQRRASVHWHRLSNPYGRSSPTHWRKPAPGRRMWSLFT